jgi:tetratricopeptide (TPR) repeat protein
MTPAQPLHDEAVAHHRAGRLREAEALYRAALAADPAHAPSHALLGLVAHQTARLDLAIDSLGQAVALSPQVAGYHCSLGNALAAQGRPETAAACYGRALQLDPDLLEALNNFGSLLQAQGQRAAAAECFRRGLALRPDLAELHFNLGNARASLGQLDDAIAGYHAALQRRAAYPEAWNNLGLAYSSRGQAEAAAECYRQALAARPEYPDAWTNLGNTLRTLGRLDEAADCHRRAIALRPDHANACNNLGNVLKDQGRLGDAAECFRRAIALRPELAAAHYNLGSVLQDPSEREAAVASLRRALSLRPDYPEAWGNLALALRRQGRPDEAMAAAREALRLQPALAEAHNTMGMLQRESGQAAAAVASFRSAVARAPDVAEMHHNLGMALLATGAFAEGWQEHEWRWQTRQLADGRRQFQQPRWRGEAAPGRTLLVHAEQGFGDTLQFCRYAALAAAQGLRVVLEVQPPLVRLLRGLDGVAGVVAQREALPPFDLHCPMMSMPLALGTTVDTIPAAPAYLRADAAAVARWRARLEASGTPAVRVGLVWAGNPRSHAPELAEIDRRRSLAPERLRPLCNIRDVQFVSLQKTGPEAPDDLPLVRLMHEMHDFADTAALVANLDLVISVDTAVAHLAAGLGVPVWLLDRFDPCWRWLTHRRDSPWYPSLRLYRQPRPGDWDLVVAEAAGDLQRLARTHRTGRAA